MIYSNANLDKCMIGFIIALSDIKVLFIQIIEFQIGFNEKEELTPILNIHGI